MRVNPTDIQDYKVQSDPMEKEMRNHWVLAWTTLSQRLHGFHLLSFLPSLLFPRLPSETPLSPFLSFSSFPLSFFSHLCLFSFSFSLSLPLINPVFFTCSWFNMQSLNQYIFSPLPKNIIGSVFHYCNTITREEQVLPGSFVWANGLAFLGMKLSILETI